MTRLKSLLERGLLTVTAAGGASGSPGGLILAYHNIVPDESPVDGEATLHLSRAAFAAQLDVLRRSHDVVPLEALLQEPPSARGRPRAAITFDDAYRGAVTLGVSEVVARGLPATLFVAPGLLGAASFWWDALADPRHGDVDADARRHAMETLRGDDTAVRAWARAAGLPLRSPSDVGGAATEAELRAAAERPGISVAPHSWSHRNLAVLEEDELATELARPLDWLRRRFSAVLPWLSYPYGRWSPAVARAAAAAGYHAGVRVGGGHLAGAPRAPYALPRVNVPGGVSREGFELRLRGLLCR